ncbi:TetR/AcrR family transcriptional regulator [Nocardia stercoris]|uniref:TetR/AcrR family transcriptional regulator n=1 Tax=Nocardia stercoris TaxID=2483361 RepID=A0A3M2L391_9NOCA|nr:TetR family transcriptional regulator [Nocardia stercoris]RMI31446.1 TetR/AcrR family transcriptional regulator [Nocardia stercoris]
MGRPRAFGEEVVVARAMETFWTHGYANNSPAQLAEATGIAKGSLYNAFTSELFDRCLGLHHHRTITVRDPLVG